MLHQLYKLKFVAAFLFVLIFAAAIAQQKSDVLLLKKFRQIKGKDSSEAYARELIGMAQKRHDHLFEARILLAQSLKVYKNGDEVRALDLAYKASKLTSPADSETYTKSTTMVAYMLSRRGRNVEALKTAFDILRKTDARGWRKQGIDCRNCVADLYRTMGDPKSALPYALQAARDALSLRDTAMYSYSLSTLSNIYSSKPIDSPANLLLASRYLEILLNPPFSAKLTPYNKAQYLTNLGRVYEKQHQFVKAEKTLQQSLAISADQKFAGLENHSLNELMTNEKDLHHYREAIKYGMQALAIAHNTQITLVQIRNIYDQLSQCYIGLGDYKNALAYYQKKDTIKDSLNSIEKYKAAAELDETYKADKRLIIANDKERISTLQRNFIIIISIITLLVLTAVFRWLTYKKKKETALLNEQHKQLARLDAMKTKFFANISHELRTPLTLIIGPAEHLLNTPAMDENQHQNHLQTIFRNSKKLLNMVNELLDLGKIEAGALSVKLKPVDLCWFINVIYQGFASAAAYKNIHYNLTNLIAEKEFVELDTDKFEKIANNLISNAIKFTPSYGSVNVVAVFINDIIEFKVSDNGKGIHPDDLPLIFDRYYQGNRDQTTLEGGTGIGLAIVREFTELLGGTITVESIPEVGSVFKLSIPKITASRPVTDLEQTLPEFAEQPAGSNGGQLVMVVEDHQEMAQYICSIIKPFYRVVAAFNGKEALNMLKAEQELPALIISDVMMPEMDGFALLDYLKHDAAWCRIPVIMLTALGDPPNKLKALNTGVDDYLTKPFASSELLARIGNLLRNASQRFSFSAQDEQELIELTGQDISPTDSPLNQNTHRTSPADLLWLSGLETLVKKHIGKTDLNIAILSDEMAISERQLFRRIKSLTGLTPNIYIRAIRLQIARQAIESGRYRTISEVSHIAGFDTPAYFSKLFKEYYGRDVSGLL